MKSTLLALILSAGDWLAMQPKERANSGVVLLWNGRVYGWKDSLRDAGHERPGALAVDIEGRIYEAQGGSDEAGAAAWVVVPERGLN